MKRLKPHWKKLNSQAIQDITDRIDRSYTAFFTHIKENRYGKKRPPHFRKRKKYRSFTLKTSGYKFCDDNVVYIQKTKYKFFKSQEIEGTIKTVTVKKSPSGKFFLYVVTDADHPLIDSRTGKSVGIDFGLSTFLTLCNGDKIKSPEFFKNSLNGVRAASRAFSFKEKGSHNYDRAFLKLALTHERVANKRKDFFFKLAHELCKEYDYIAIEDLNLKGMQRMWGRKVSDVAYGEFVSILKHIASKYKTTICKVDRFAPTTKACHVCGSITELSLKDREWTCPDCGTHHDRDINAAINIRNIAFS